MTNLAVAQKTTQLLFDAEKFASDLAISDSPVSTFRKALHQADAALSKRYYANENINEIVRDRAWVLDQLLCFAWNQFQWPDPDNISLVAVGGYGRGELHPHSDIDLLILTRKSRHTQYQDNIRAFLTILFDMKLEVGHSVRSIKQCKQQALADITVATALMESRTLAGPGVLQEEMAKLTSAKKVWPAKVFLRAKWDEQIQRHEKYHNVDYALEPNIKTSPGGLRDIQTIAWVAKRQYGASSFHDLVELGFLKPSEEAVIDKGRRLLWKLRYGLHLLEGRREDRLLFDKQRELARLFGYEDDEKSLGVEKLMQQYYRIVATLRALNDVLLQHLDEAILRAGEKARITPINSRFQIRNDYIEVTAQEVFAKSPYALLELFVLMAQNPDIKGVRASTLRLLRDNRRLVDEAFRHDIRNVSLFMELLRSEHQVARQLRRMSRYGILGRYLPEFGLIMGKMQHDLFHIYTVDAHTLQVVENMRRFRLTGAQEKFPVAAHIMNELPKPELLYIAGLYHDIAKGRGGDHSTLGMEDAEKFCRRHHLSDWDTKLVIWLVNKHLLMSMTAQRRDTDDPEVIHEFASEMGDKLHLDYLYALTVADICATNPDLWNAWRASLMRRLYQNTKRALQLGLENPVNRADRIHDKQQTAMPRLIDKGLSFAQIKKIWDEAGEEYFIRESVSNICWHTEAIAKHKTDGPLIAIRNVQEHGVESATQVFIYTGNSDFLFANSTAAFEKLNLNIQSARIFTTNNNYCMDTYTLLESNSDPVSNDPERLREITTALVQSLTNKNKPMTQAVSRRQRKLKSFSQHITTALINRPERIYSTLEINCPDQTGILACVGKIFAEHEINLRDARLATLGERVEDLFFITDVNGGPLTDEARIKALQDDIKAGLQQRLAT